MKGEGKSVAIGDTVLLHYRLATPEGVEISSTFDDDPESFVIGEGELAENLERCVVGLAEGERRVFHLAPAEAFGEADPQMVRELDREDFPSKFPLIEGSLVQFEMPDGRTVTGAVKSWTDDKVTVDFNHPLCGCPVVFEVEVVEIC
ncbi:MAG TPA: FKBP-type peptidyl-prolyl cis-trans isomerase [Burkholderiales bacterium]|nr:FKBP-type peptidyl-prolyl cis-trans isomerase [Burkholderiales bacterium]